jgi:predicted HAD superfamily phosphohydrolase YqeG
VEIEPVPEVPFYDQLEKVDPPFLKRKGIMDYPYTLVLDLDETLIHFRSSEDEQDDPDG